MEGAAHWSSVSYPIPIERKQQLLWGCSSCSRCVALSSHGERDHLGAWLYHKPKRPQGCLCSSGFAFGFSLDCTGPLLMSTVVLATGATSQGHCPPGGNAVCVVALVCVCLYPSLFPFAWLLLCRGHHLETFRVALTCLLGQKWMTPEHC